MKTVLISNLTEVGSDKSLKLGLGVLESRSISITQGKYLLK